MQPRLRAIALARTVLPVPGHVLDQEVAAAQQRDEGEAHLVVLADDHALDVGEDLLPGLLDLVIGLSQRNRASGRVADPGFDGMVRPCRRRRGSPDAPSDRARS